MSRYSSSYSSYRSPYLDSSSSSRSSYLDSHSSSRSHYLDSPSSSSYLSTTYSLPSYEPKEWVPIV